MNKLIIIGFTLTILIINIPITSASDNTIYVDDDFNESTPGWNVTHFNSIQKAVNKATSGDTVFVNSGTYYEHVQVSESILLAGENRETTIINGTGTGSVLYIDCKDVTVKGFTILNGSKGVEISSSFINIEENIIKENTRGIELYGSFNFISKNKIVNNKHGIDIWSMFSLVYKNKISNNNLGIYLYVGGGWSPSNQLNLISHNNLIENIKHASVESNAWSIFIHTIRFRRNYWDDWEGLEDPSKSFYPYVIELTDNVQEGAYLIDWLPKRIPNLIL